METYNPKEIEARWQEKWLKEASFRIDKDDTSKEKFYILDMFPYPSGTGLHMGHTESYTASDVFYRYKKMQGFNVLHPQGFDAFGLPAENFAIKTGVHPAETTKQNMANYIRQMQSLGFDYDFSEQAVTSDPEYYKWTQWIFSEFYKNGLVYKKTTKTNWCPSCQTVLANEQVIDGKCDRCGTEIMQKEVPTWFFKITDFAEELIADLDNVDWPEYTKKNQRAWIGKSEGAELEFRISNSELRINVFTTRVDTVFGVTYVVVAPEHEILKQVQDDKIKIGNRDEVLEYIEKSKSKTELDRMEAKEKTGVELEGIKVINPFNNEEIPVYVADYVLGNYGTGAVMAVPAHDERDFEFAKKYNLEIKCVVEPDYDDFDIKDIHYKSAFSLRDGLTWNESLTETLKYQYSLIKQEKKSSNFYFKGDGILINSENFSDLSSNEAREKMTDWLEKEGLGKKVTNYRLRDWSISRQRYWGCPIPIVYSPAGEPHLVPQEHLPWELPTDVDFVPTGVSPLAKSKELQERTEKIFGKGWVAEYDTMDTFVDSAWYFLRYPDVHNAQEFCSLARREKWLPVDVYIGGAEHTYMHLLYARFIVKALHKIGHLNFSEPFLKLRHQGMVLDKEGKKMSKSKGNVINPDDMVAKFGADSVRTYMLFVAPLEDAVIWNEENIVGVRRFLERTWNYLSWEEIHRDGSNNSSFEKWKMGEVGETTSALKGSLNKTIKKVTEDIENFKFNTAVSSLMIFLNIIYKFSENKTFPNRIDMESTLTKGMNVGDFEKFIQLLSPFAPHLAEEIWQKLGHTESIFSSEWPKYDPKLIKDEEINLVVQVNGKVRDNIMVNADITEEDAKKIAMESEKIKVYTTGKEIRKIIFVPGKLLNIVV